MISGSKIGTLACTLMLSLPVAAASAPAPDDATGALIAGLGRPAPARTAFAEARFMQVLERPLVVSGELAWLGGDTLQRHVLAPREETATIAAGEVSQQRPGQPARSFSIKHAPQLQALVDSFVALLSGDAGRLREAFAIARRGDAGGDWSLILTPRDTRLVRTIATIRIDGRRDQPRCMHMQEADGDLAVDLLGPLAARMPAQPTREALDALCRAK